MNVGGDCLIDIMWTFEDVLENYSKVALLYLLD